MLQTIIKEITGTKQNSFLKTKLSFTSGGELPKIMSAKKWKRQTKQNIIPKFCGNYLLVVLHFFFMILCIFSFYKDNFCFNYDSIVLSKNLIQLSKNDLSLLLILKKVQLSILIECKNNKIFHSTELQICLSVFIN